MFWKDNHVVSFSINSLLECGDLTLKELLDKEDILQECRSSNKQLIEFLSRPYIIYELVKLIVEEPPDNVNIHQRYKYSSLASEVIASRVSGLSDVIAMDPRIMDKLYSFLDGKPPLNPLLASYFSKAIEVLFTHSSGQQDWYTYQFRCLQVVEYFKSCPDFLPKFLNHLGTSGILNSLETITEFNNDDVSNNILTWLDSQQLIEKLISIICGTYTPVLYNSDTSNNNTANTQIANAEEAPSCKDVQECPSDAATPVPSITQETEQLSDALVQKVDAQQEAELPKDQQTSDTEIPNTSTENINTSIESKECSLMSVVENHDTSNESVPVIENQQDNDESKPIIQNQQDNDDSKPVIENQQDDNESKPVIENQPDINESKPVIENQQDSNESKPVIQNHEPCPAEGDNLNASSKEEQTDISKNPPADEAKGEEGKEEDINKSLVANGPVLETLSVNSERYETRLLSSRSANASQLITNFIWKGRENPGQKCNNPLYVKSTSGETITHLLESMFAAPQDKRKIALLNGIQVLLVLLNDKSGTSQVLEPASGELMLVTQAIIPFIPYFIDVLKNPPEDKKHNQNGVTKKSVGAVRLAVTNLFMVLVNNLITPLAITLMELDVFNLLLDMFFEYDFNNFLHSHVEGIMRKAFAFPIFKEHFFTHCNLLERLNDAWNKAESTESPRPGYMGHLISIVSAINSHYNLARSEGTEADVWQQLSNKLLRAMANQNTVLGCIHDDSLEDQSDSMDMVQQRISSEIFDLSKDLFAKMCTIKSNSTMDSWTLNVLNSPDWAVATDVVFDDAVLSEPNIIDSCSSPWNDVASDDNLQSGWADFENLQETAGISVVPNNFTCEAFVASENQNDFTGEFFDNFADLRLSNPNLERLEQIQADTAIDSGLVIDVPSNDNTAKGIQFDVNIDQQEFSSDKSDAYEISELKSNKEKALPSDSDLPKVDIKVSSENNGSSGDAPPNKILPSLDTNPNIGDDKNTTTTDNTDISNNPISDSSTPEDAQR